MIVHNSHYEKFADGTVRCIDDEIPFEIPSSWQWCNIRDICSMQAGKNISSEKIFSEQSASYPFRCIGGNGLRGFVATYNTEGSHAIVGRQGALCGCLNIECGRFYATEHAVVVDNYGQINHKFMYWFLMAMNLNQYATATAQPGLSVAKILEVKFPLPPIAEQYRIVERLESILPNIERYSKVQQNLDTLNNEIKTLLQKSVLQEAIQGKLVPQYSKDEPASVLLQRIKSEKERLIKEKKIKRDKQESIIFRGDDNCYFEKLYDGTVQKLEVPFDIPGNWEWVRLGDLVYNLSGLSYKKEDLEVKHDFPIRVLRGGNIVDGTWLIKDDDIKISPQFVKPDLLLKAGTFITPAVSSFEQVGKTGLIETDLADTVVGGFVLMLVPFYKEALLLRYLLYLFQTPFYKSLCQSMVNKSGQAFYNLSRTKLMNATIPLPPIEEQKRIVKYLDAIFTHIR